MKARIPPQNRLSRETLRQCAEYANSLQDANNKRIFKLVHFSTSSSERTKTMKSFGNKLTAI